MGEVEKVKKERINKREANIQARIDQKKAKKMGKVGSGSLHSSRPQNQRRCP